MFRKYQHRETEYRGERRDEHRGAGGGDALRSAAPFVEFARDEKHTVILADANDENDEHAVHHVNWQSEPAHCAKGPKKAEGKRQNSGNDKLNCAERKIDDGDDQNGNPERRMTKATAGEIGDVLGKGSLIQNDHFRHGSAKPRRRLYAIIQFEQRRYRVVARSKRDALVQDLVERRAAKHFEGQKFWFGFDALPENLERIRAKSHFGPDLRQHFSQLFSLFGGPKGAPALDVCFLGRDRRTN